MVLKNKDYLSEDDINLADLNFYKPQRKEEMINKNISQIYYYNYFKNWNRKKIFIMLLRILDLYWKS